MTMACARHILGFVTLMITATAKSLPLPTMDEFLVEGLEEVEPEYAKFEGTMYAGLLPMNNNGNRRGELMFWFFAPDHPGDPDSVTVWLNGGPGCSSFNGGVLFENSPVTVPLRPAGYCCSKADEPLVYNPHAWTRATNILYVEQPVGVGFSTGGPEPLVEADLAGDFFSFLQNFFRVFEPYQSSRLFLVGESFAGYFVPSIAHKIYKDTNNFDDGKEKDDNVIRLNLEGVGLGNGWADARVQGPGTIDYGYWHGLYDGHTRQALHAEWDHCIHGPKHQPEPHPFHKFTPPDDCAFMMADLMAGGKGVWSKNMQGPNAYDVTTWDPYPALLGGNSTIESFFNDPRVKEKLHAPEDVYWRGCIPGAGRRLQEGRRILFMLDHDRPLSTVPYLAEMLDAGIRVLIYNGDRDLSTCAQGSEMLLNDMKWSGSDEWFTTPRGMWVNTNSEDKGPAGYAKSLKGLDFVVVYNSGHLVPYNQPANALDLITRFIRNESFWDYSLPDFDFYHKTFNPKTSLANGMYRMRQVESTERTPHHHFLIVFFAMACCFVAGIFSSKFFMGRSGYVKL